MYLSLQMKQEEESEQVSQFDIGQMVLSVTTQEVTLLLVTFENPLAHSLQTNILSSISATEHTLIITGTGIQTFVEFK
jgi:hypothetical protein